MRQRMSSEAIVAELRKTRLPHANVILQLEHVPSLRERRELEDLGIRLHTPLSGNAWLASVPTSLSSARIKTVPVRWVGFLTAAEKLAPSLRTKRATEHAKREAGRLELLVKLFVATDSPAVIEQLEQLGGEVRRDASKELRTLVVSIPEGRLGALANVDGIRYIEPTLPPGRPESDRARAYINADAVQAAGTDGSGVTVGVFEYEHVYAAHPDFGGRVTKGDADATFYDPDVAHATMTAGMIAGDGSLSSANGGAPLQWRGVAPDASVRFYAFEDPVDSITNYMGDVQDAIENDDIDVANNSWGDSGCADIAYGAYAGRAPFLDDAVCGSFGRQVPIIFSVGNERNGFWDSGAGATSFACVGDNAAPFENYGTLNHPKAAKNILAVGAVDSDNDRMSVYSSWGPTLDGRLKPEVVAAGHHNGGDVGDVTELDNVFGAEEDAWGNVTYGNPSQQGYRVPYRFDPGNANDYRYGWFTMTSAAAAEVSGSYALILDAWRATFPGRPDPLPSTYKAIIVHTADDLDNATSWYNRGPDYASGYGRVNVEAAVTSVERREALEDQVDHGASATYYLGVTAGTAPLKITLAWDDPAAVEDANPALINDLDLVVTAPDGTRHYPWTLNPAVPSAAAQRNQADRINNLEQVEVDAPMEGTWEVSVVGHSVPDGPQFFSVVADNGPIRRPLDLILALDVSNSMNSAPSGGGAVPTKIALLRQAVELFLQTWSLHAVTGDRVGVVYFSTNLSTVSGAPPVLLDLETHLVGIIDDVRFVSASGCTAMGAALQEAFDSFDPLGHNKRAVVLFTDGMQSTNPFVGEDGMPSRLKIQSYPSAAVLPFGAFRCDPGTALALDGDASTPDGSFVDEHGVQIHTIGTGVSGAGFEEVIERIASETDGLYHFTSAPDAELDLFYTQDLVQSLKGNTLEIVRTDAGDLSAGGTRTMRFPINATARNITVVLSWKGSLQRDAISVVVTTPGGNQAVAAEARRGTHYTLLRFDRAQNPIEFDGVWTVALGNDVPETLGFQQSILVDEEACFGYTFAHDTGLHLAGDKIHVTAKLTEYGRPLVGAKTVAVSVSAPIVSRGNLLAEWLPRVQRKPLRKEPPMQFKSKPYRIGPNAVIEPLLAQLNKDKEFLAQLNRRETWSIQLVDNGDKRKGDWKAGDGIYSAFVANTVVAGDYSLAYNIGTESNCGQISRSQRASLLVRCAKFDLDKSDIRVERIPEGATIHIRPMDRFGNLLGPGHAHEVGMHVKDGRLAGTVFDNLDGSYQQRITFKKGFDPEISIRIGGPAAETLMSGRLSQLGKARVN
ncbi:MAG: S8 family serine peptidase [Sedimentisphaerales bacterium]|nr:S8 family serine peptidase [Sedimentisphaerales bacterium]